MTAAWALGRPAVAAKGLSGRSDRCAQVAVVASGARPGRFYRRRRKIDKLLLCGLVVLTPEKVATDGCTRSRFLSRRRWADPISDRRCHPKFLDDVLRWKERWRARHGPAPRRQR